MTVKDRIQKIIETMPDSEAIDLLHRLEEQQKEKRAEFLQKSAEEIIEEIARQIPEHERKRVPAELLENLDHYIYGTSKK
ncbi:MAG: hypothetical protein KY468_12265 [Armatimonadetes bacterium]|nr:hypothetical protein [Armatimonadota bacterium]